MPILWIPRIVKRRRTSSRQSARILNHFAIGQICGYQLSQYKHDDLLDRDETKIPFLVQLIDGRPVLELKSAVKQLDCEWKQTYRLFIRAVDCAGRYSER